MKATHQDRLQTAALQVGESIQDYCERTAIVSSRREGSGVECRVVTPTIYATLPAGYQYDDCGTEQDEPATGAEYRFSAGRSNPLSPFGGWDMVATCTREDDLLILDIEQAD
jgi:hypothetical protein